MKIHRFIPAWRKRDGHATPTIEIVSEPTEQWFSKLTPLDSNGCQHVRLAFMTDGSLYFGDGYHVVHHDICQARGKCNGVETEPFVVGVMMRIDGHWRMCNAQLFGHAISEDVLPTTRWLLRALAVWPSIVAALGEDPLDKPTAGEPMG